MTNPNDKEWWRDKGYYNYDENDLNGVPTVPDIERIVAEAERRGRVAAWEEIKNEIRDARYSMCYVGMPQDALASARRAGIQDGMQSLDNSLQKRIEDKLSSLTKE